MPYTLFQAIKDEIDFLESLEKVEDSRGHTISALVARQQARSLQRIVMRYDQGYEYTIDPDKKNKFYISYKKTNRKTIREEYPALKKIAEQYEILELLVNSEVKNQE